jgi:hypothetical protein
MGGNSGTCLYCRFKICTAIAIYGENRTARDYSVTVRDSETE